MNSPFSKGTLYLKRKNQDLLAQLESNSAILQDRLEKLKGLWPSPPESTAQLQCTHFRSPLKRKHTYESWLLRNNSGQVSAALNPDVFWNSTPSPILNHSYVSLTSQYIDKATTMSPAKRPKRYDDQYQERQGNTSEATPLVSSRKIRQKSQSRRNCPECYCQMSKQQPVPKKHGIKHAVQVCIGCSDYKIPNNSVATLDNSHSNLDSQRKILEEARSLISYSPESVFLKGLKERSKVNLDDVETSSPEVNQSTRNVNAQGNTRAREVSRQSAKGHSYGVGNVTNKSKHPKAAAKSASLAYSNDTEKPERTRPLVKKSSFGASNVSGKSDNSSRRGISESTSKSGRRQDQSSKESSQPIANSSVPCRSTSASTRKFTSNVCSRNISTVLSRTSKPTCDEQKSSIELNSRPTVSSVVPCTSTATKYPSHSPTKNICRPALARLIQTPSHKTAISPPVINNIQPATRSTRTNASPHNEIGRPRFKSSKRSSISSAKDNSKPDALRGKSKTSKAKSRAVNSQATSFRRNPRISPTVSSSSSPSSSPARRDFKVRTKSDPRSKESTCPVQRREDCRPAFMSPVTKSKKIECKFHPRESDYNNSDVPARGVQSCCYAGTNLKTTPIASSPCKKYKNVYKPYCKKYSRKDCVISPDMIENKPLNYCYHNIVSPTVVHCKPYKRSHRKLKRKPRSCGNSCCKHCCCGCRQLAGYDKCPRLVDGEPVMRRSHSCGRAITRSQDQNPSQDEWVDEMSKYRQSHWFDCHAYPTNRERPMSSRGNSEFQHTHRDGAHRYILNDRLFPTPLPCTSHCVQCRQAGDAELRPLQQTFPREITLNTVKNRDEVQVVLPQAPFTKHRADEQRTGPFKIYHDLEKKAKCSRKSTGCMLTHPIHSKPLLSKFPVPANSLALRYQKGIV